MNQLDTRNQNPIVGSYDDYVWSVERFLDVDNQYKYNVIGMHERKDKDVIYNAVPYTTYRLAYDTCIHLANFND